MTTFNRGRGVGASGRRPRCSATGSTGRTLDGRVGRRRRHVGAGSAGGAGVRGGARRARERYVYISSCSVYAPPPVMGADEHTPTVAPEGEDYANVKRGGEVAVQAAFGDRAHVLRPGLILGPHEDVGRLPWWLLRLARGGDALAPGPPDLPLQLIDARDLAAFALDAPSGDLQLGQPPRPRDDALAAGGRARGHRRPRARCAGSTPPILANMMWSRGPSCRSGSRPTTSTPRCTARRREGARRRPDDAARRGDRRRHLGLAQRARRPPPSAPTSRRTGRARRSASPSTARFGPGGPGPAYSGRDASASRASAMIPSREPAAA